MYLAFARFLLWRADLLPAEFLNALRELGEFPPVPRDTVVALLQRELGDAGEELIWQMEDKPVWSTLSRTAYLSWHRGQIVVVQVAREPVSDTALRDFEAGIAALGHPDLRHLTSPRILRDFRQWLRNGESMERERSYLEVLGRSRGSTLVDYPELIPEISTNRVLCWPWVEGEPVSAMIQRGVVDAVTKVAEAVLEQYFSLAIVDADLQLDSIVTPTGANRLTIRQIGRPISVPPPAVNLGMKYVAAVLEGNASMTVQTLLTMAVGQSTADLESELLNLMSGVEPELKVHAWYPGSAAALESNWRALARLHVTRQRPLYLDCLHRNLIAVGYWTGDAVSAGGNHVDTITEAQWPVLDRVLRINASQFLDAAAVKEWSVGLGLLTVGAMREANRLAEELRDNNLTWEVKSAEPDLHEDDKTGPPLRIVLSAGALLVALLVLLRWGSALRTPAPGLIPVLALCALAGLFWTVSKIR